MRSVPQRHAGTDPEAARSGFGPGDLEHRDSERLEAAPFHSVAKVVGSSPVCPVAKTSTRSETEPQAAGAPVSPRGSRPRHRRPRDSRTSKEPSSLLAAHVEQVAVRTPAKHIESALRPGCRRRAASPRAAARKARPFFARPKAERPELAPAPPAHSIMSKTRGGPAREQDHSPAPADGDRAVQGRSDGLPPHRSTLPERLGDLLGRQATTPPGTGRAVDHLLDCFVYSLVRIQP